MTPTLFAGSWHNGLFVIEGDRVRHELADRPVRGLVAEGHGVLAIVGRHQLCRRTPDGVWETLSTSEAALSCVLVTAGAVLVGTDDAQVLRLEGGSLRPLSGFAGTAGRDSWYAGTAVIDGRVIGPPLGVRSLAATCDEAVVFANVHVRGIPRTLDGGANWEPTVDIDWDVHQVCTHPARPEIVAAAAGVGVCISRDQGATWARGTEGLHAPYCSAVTLCGEDLLVCAAQDHFATSAGLYRLPLADPAAIAPVAFGESRWLGGVIDTYCLVCTGDAVACIDRSGHLHRSEDGGHSWERYAQRFAMSSGLLLMERR